MKTIILTPTEYACFLAIFNFLKGVASNPLMPSWLKQWVSEHMANLTSIADKINNALVINN